MSHTAQPVMRTALKPHTCYLCGETITVGSNYMRHAGTSDGHWWSANAHRGCHWLIQDTTMFDVAHGSVLDYVTEPDGTLICQYPLRELGYRVPEMLVWAFHRVATHLWQGDIPALYSDLLAKHPSGA